MVVDFFTDKLMILPPWFFTKICRVPLSQGEGEVFFSGGAFVISFCKRRFGREGGMTSGGGRLPPPDAPSEAAGSCGREGGVTGSCGRGYHSVSGSPKVSRKSLMVRARRLFRAAKSLPP